MTANADAPVFASLFPPGRKPFEWQSTLYSELLAGSAPESVSLPTATGKTYGILRCWLGALADAPQKVPRRLAYIVNRRAVIDQVYEDALALAEAVASPDMADALCGRIAGCDPADPLKVYAFRGQRTLDHDWLSRPEQPAILIGTVDMLGSRLLFRAYVGSGDWRRAQSAGLLGQDTWFVLDEPHLAHPFRNLLSSISTLQSSSTSLRPFWFTQIGATNRGRGGTNALIDAVRRDAALAKRLNAPKRVVVATAPVDEAGFIEKSVEIVTDALSQGAPISIGIVVSTVRLARQLSQVLNGAKLSLPQSPSVFAVTGAMRGIDRDILMERQDFRESFMASTRTRAGSAILAGTHCLEAGFDGDFDLLISDITSVPSLLQRLGRLNRIGNSREAIAHVFEIAGRKVESPDRLAGDCRKWLASIAVASRGSHELSGSYQSDALPSLLSTWDSLDAPSREALSEPTIAHPPFEAIDALLFSSSSSLPGGSKMRTELYLHGYDKPERADTSFVWREEARWLSDRELVRGLELRRPLPAEMALTSPAAAREELSVLLRRLHKNHLSGLADKVSLLDPWSGEVGPAFRLGADGKHYIPDVRELANRVVILPPEAGGYGEGFIDGGADGVVRDLGEDARRETTALCAWCWTGKGLVPSGEASSCVPPPDDFSLAEELPAGLRALPESLSLFAETGWLLLRPTQPRTRNTSAAVGLEDHLVQVTEVARQICDAIPLPNKLAEHVIDAAMKHDTGKAHHGFQHYLGNSAGAKPLAKSEKGAGGRSPFRHEALSVLREGLCGQLQGHLVGTHHGFGRPVFPPGTGVPHAGTRELNLADGEWLRSFARLSEEFNPWSLAWLESLLRAADARASADPVTVEEEAP